MRRIPSEGFEPGSHLTELTVHETTAAYNVHTNELNYIPLFTGYEIRCKFIPFFFVRRVQRRTHKHTVRTYVQNLIFEFSFFNRKFEPNCAKSAMFPSIEIDFVQKNYIF